MKVARTLNNKVVEAVNSGGIAVISTDTIYGIIGSALSPKTVEKIYRLRKRNRVKPMIILIGDIGQLSFFGIKLDRDTKNKLNRLWPGKVSVILPCYSKKFFYLHRGKKTLAFRLPSEKSLKTFIMKTGPIVAPSANIEGCKPAATIKEAKRYFGDKPDFYVDQGRRGEEASTLVDFSKKKIKILRKGAVKINPDVLND
jgi:L-threonylcarbamoyladenylate synthase